MIKIKEEYLRVKFEDASIWKTVVDIFSNPCNAWAKRNTFVDNSEICVFYSLRKEFMLQRSAVSPFQPSGTKKLGKDFKYSHYQVIYC
jgi:hypothetical protein